MGPSLSCPASTQLSVYMRSETATLNFGTLAFRWLGDIKIQVWARHNIIQCGKLNHGEVVINGRRIEDKAAEAE